MPLSRARVRAPLRLLLLSLLLLAAPRRAEAHAALRRAEPASGARLAVPPREIRLTFSEAIELAVSSVELRGPDGAPVPLDPLRLEPDSPGVLVAPIRAPVGAGRYTVRWRVAAADGHPTHGSYSFVVLPPASSPGPSAAAAGTPRPPAAAPAGPPVAPTTATGASADSVDDARFEARSAPYVALRVALYAALLAALGAVAFGALVIGRLRHAHGAAAPVLAPAARRAAAVGLAASLLLFATALLRLYAQSYALHGPAGALDPRHIGALLGHTLWGRGWILQVIASLGAAASFALLRRRADGGGSAARWAPAAVAALALALVPALSGHAASAERSRALAIVADAVHVAGAGSWIGGLLVLAGAGLPAAMRLPDGERHRAVAALVDAFSPVALGAAALVAASGLLAAWIHVGAADALVHTGYGRLLLLKVALLVPLASLGAWNWRRVRPALGDAAGSARIARSSRAELLVGLAVIVVTAVLVATPTPAAGG